MTTKDILSYGVKPYNDEMSIYIHIPFCISKCTYCNFCSFANATQYVDAYIDALCKEIQTKATIFGYAKITTIFIGGGTPSLVPSQCILKILDCLRANFKISDNISITIESNPNSLTRQKLLDYKSAGINRLSVGLQSTKSRLLRILGRAHTTKDFVNAITMASDTGFENINADIILGVPTQTLKDVDDTLDLLLSLPLKHISAYGLILEPNTPLSQLVKQREYQPLSDDLCNAMYDRALTRLSNIGMHRYEISNFAFSGFEAEHNLNYWRRGQYLGLGLDAYSFVHGLHWQNTNNLSVYLKSNFRMLNKEPETRYTAMIETIMLALRMDEGLDIIKFNKDFDTDFLKEYATSVTKLKGLKLIKIEDNHLKVLDQHISNAIIAEFA